MSANIPEIVKGWKLGGSVSIVALTATLAAHIMVDGAAAQQVTVPVTAAQAATLPGTNHVITPAAFAGPGSEQSLKDLQNAIADWLAFEFGFPKIPKQATIAFAPASRMTGLRFRNVPSDHWTNDKTEVLAIYDEEARTIYLSDGWTGRTAADLSVLVHEMVHHLQNVGGSKFACPEEREKIAFEAQERWLNLFGRSLEAEFELDPLTVLVRTNCHY